MITTQIITDARRSLFLGITVRRTMLVVLFICKSREFLNRTLQGLGEISGFNLLGTTAYRVQFCVFFTSVVVRLWYSST